MVTIDALYEGAYRRKYSGEAFVSTVRSTDISGIARPESGRVAILMIEYQDGFVARIPADLAAIGEPTPRPTR